MEHHELYTEFKHVTDTPAKIRKWVEDDNKEIREKASLEKNDPSGTPSGRDHAEKVLRLLNKSEREWSDDEWDFAERVVNYAKRSGGISEHHPHNDKAEIGDSGMTKNEIARQNWGLPAVPK